MLGALCTGAERVMLPEQRLTLADLERDVATTKVRFRRDANAPAEPTRCGIVIKNERAGGDVFTLDVLVNLFAAESAGRFSVRKSVLGHLQQGGLPTPIDRFRALRLALAAAERVVHVFDADKPKECEGDDAPVECVGLQAGKTTFTDMEQVSFFGGRGGRARGEGVFVGWKKGKKEFFLFAHSS